jgi:hypothetical protein
MLKRTRTVVLLALMAMLTVGGVAYAGGDSSGHGWFGWGHHHAGGFGHHDLGDAEGHIVAGKITAVGASSLTIAGHDGTGVTVKVDAGTRVYSGHDPAQLSDLKAGWVAFVFKGDDGVASVVRAADPAAVKKSMDEMRAHMAAGKITAVGTDSLTLADRDGATLTVTTDSSTKVYAMRKQVQLSALKPGWFAFVQKGDDGVADVVRAADPAAIGKAFHDHDRGHGFGWDHGRVVMGKITAVGASSITITGRDGKAITVKTDSGTKVYAMRDTARLSALKVGWFAVVVKGKDGVAHMIRAADRKAFGHHGGGDDAPGAGHSDPTT